jgi:AraC-like DNA-binding protein
MERLSLDDVWGRRARRLARRVRVHDNVDDLICSIEEVVAEEVPSHETDSAMRAAYRLIERGPPPDAPLVPWLMRALEMSERTLRRRFDESFGYGPKTLDRILRHQRFLRLSSRSNRSTAILAAEVGYSDQAHLVRESRRLTGSTPHQLNRLLKGE